MQNNFDKCYDSCGFQYETLDSYYIGSGIIAKEKLPDLLFKPLKYQCSQSNIGSVPIEFEESRNVIDASYYTLFLSIYRSCGFRPSK